MILFGYFRSKSRYESILEELKEKEIEQNKTTDIINIYNNGLKKLNGIDLQFFKSDIHHKRNVLGSIFPKKFQFENNEVRTADINPILLKIARVYKGIKKGTNQKKMICPGMY
jgi:site-specific DNA recombinase